MVKMPEDSPARFQCKAIFSKVTAEIVVPTGTWAKDAQKFPKKCL
jgi:hypothetical protein